MILLFLFIIEEVFGICCLLDGCSKVYKFSGLFGIFFSFDYFYYYLDDVKCIWIIFVFDDKVVKLMFERF